MLRRSYVNKKNIFIVFALVLVVLLVFRPSIGSVSFTSYPSDPEGQTVQIRRPYYPVARDIKVWWPLGERLFVQDPRAAGSTTKSYQLASGEMIYVAKFLVNQLLEDEGLSEVVLAVKFGDTTFEYEAASFLGNTVKFDGFAPIGIYGGDFLLYSTDWEAPIPKSGIIARINWPPVGGDLETVFETDELAWQRVLDDIDVLSEQAIQSLCSLRLKGALRFIEELSEMRCP